MATPVIEIHTLLSERASPVTNNPTTKTDDDVILAVQLAVAFTASRFLNVESFLPPSVIATFGQNSFIVNAIWLLVLFFALRYWMKNLPAKPKIDKSQ